MNPAQLLEHFDRISEAPDAVARLRRFILDLAVRGKLVEQDTNDEPAVELLKRIQMEVQKRRTAGAYTDPRNAIELPLETLPFRIPDHWQWARLTEIADVSYGFAFESTRFNGDRRGMRLIRIRDISNTDTEAYFDGEFDESYLVRRGDYLIGMDGNFNARKWSGPDALLNQRVLRLNKWKASVNADFFAIPLQMILDHLHVSTSQTTVKHLSAKQMNGVYVPLPPLAEQHRIVDKVDELMALCDQLEGAKNEREARRDRLVAASLHRIDTAPAAADEVATEVQNVTLLRDAARFHIDHLRRLTTRPEHIKQLRQTILNLAVRGRLVPQDPNDEPAAELRKRIEGENSRLQQAKGIRPQKPAEPNKTFEGATDIPNSWVHAYLQDLAYQITDGTHQTPKYTKQGKPFLSAQNIKPFRFIPKKHRLVSSTDFENYRANRKPERDDVLLTRVGAGIGEAAVLDSDFEFAFYVSLCLIKIPTHLLNPDYLVLWLNSPEGRESASTRTYGKGASQGNLNLGLIRTFKIPLPPLAEQHRIVAKVNELMALCDQLEAQLTTTQADSLRLLEAVLHEALSPAQEEIA